MEENWTRRKILEEKRGRSIGEIGGCSQLRGVWGCLGRGEVGRGGRGDCRLEIQGLSSAGAVEQKGKAKE